MMFSQRSQQQPQQPPSGAAKLEVRTIRPRDVRAEKAGDTEFLVGHAANFNVLSEDLGGWKERIMPGAFARALREGQDIRHLINHDPTMILGRTKSGTTVLSEDGAGLAYRTKLGGRSYERDLSISVERGDIGECSFGFYARKQKWVVEDGLDVRELHDVDLVDISTVTYPAYPGTQAALDTRALFPDGMPAELRDRLAARGAKPPKAAVAADPCLCTCTACAGNDCTNCTDTSCNDQNCTDCPMQAARTAQAAASQFSATLAAVEAPHREMRGRIIRGVRRARKAEEERSGSAPRPEFRASVQSDGTLEMLVYDDIGESWDGDGICVKSMKQMIDQAGTHERYKLRINSGGGDVFEGIAIHNMLRAQGKPIESCIDGLAASAASVIAMCGDKISMGSSAMMMIHNCSSMACGYAADLRKEADVLDKISECAAQTYVDRTGMKLAAVQALMDAETWMSAQDCLDKGFCTDIMAPPVTPGEEDEEERVRVLAASFRSMYGYRNVPERFRPEHRGLLGMIERRRLLATSALESFAVK